MRSKLTVISASAGFGKTTLLYDFLQKSGSRASWFRLDETDREVGQFANYLTAGIEEHYPGSMRRSARAILRLDPSPTSRRRLAEVLSNELCQLPDQQFAVALDGYESVNGSAEVGDLLSYLLERTPPFLHFFITTRESPSLPMSRLRARGDLVEIDAKELVFTAGEADALIDQFDGATLDRSERSSLLEKTEGWPAGLVIALQWLRRTSPENLVSSLSSLSGETDQFYAYLAEEVLRSLDSAAQQFLMKTSIFEELFVDACDALLDTTDSRTRLASLSANGLFTLALGDGHTQFRYHQLFRDFLLARLHQQCDQDEVRSLHRKAGRAMEARGLYLQAMRHFLAAGLSEAAANVLESAGEGLIWNGFTGIIALCLEMLPVDLLPTHPWLLVLRARLLRRSYRLEDARETLDQARGLFATLGDARGLAWVACEQAAVLNRAGLYVQAVRKLEEALEYEPGLDLLTEIQVRLTTNYAAAGNLVESERVGKRVLSRVELLPSTMENAAVEVTVLSSLARTHAWLGHPKDARDALAKAAEVCQRQELSDWLHGRSLRLASEALVLLGEPQAVLEQTEASIRLVGEDKAFLDRLHFARASALIDLGRYEEAEETLERVGAEARVSLAFLRLRQGQPRDALRMATLAWNRLQTCESVVDRESGAVVLALASAATGSLDTARTHLARVASFFHGHGYSHFLASVWWQRAWVEYEACMPDDATRYLVRALDALAEMDFHHLRWWLPGPGSRLCAYALHNGIREELVSGLVMGELKGDACLPLVGLLGVSDPERHHRVLGLIRNSAGKESPLVHLLDDMLFSCRDASVRSTLWSQVAEGHILIQGVLRLRQEFDFTWRELQALVCYYLEPYWGGISLESHSRKRCAERLHLAENTLRVHLVHLRRKLGLPEGATALMVCEQMHRLGVSDLPLVFQRAIHAPDLLATGRTRGSKAQASSNPLV